MNPEVSVLTASVTTFAATNVDDLCLLTLFFARRIPGRRIFAGQFLGFAVIVFVSCLGSLLSFAIPARWTRFLGLLPLTVGVKELLQLRKAQDEGEGLAPKQTVMAVALVTIANGADNVGVYIPFFRFNSHDLWLILMVYGALVALWCFAGRWLGRHPLILHVVERGGHWIVPFVFIGLGLYILAF